MPSLGTRFCSNTDRPMSKRRSLGPMPLDRCSLPAFVRPCAGVKLSLMLCQTSKAPRTAQDMQVWQYPT